MAFDAGMMAAVANEIREKVLGCKIEKIHGPSKDEIVINFRPNADRESHKLYICAGASFPRIHLTYSEISNPAQPPIFVQMLRKHLGGAKLISVTQTGFERVLDLCFEARDEMEFKTEKHIICEIMGKCSNIILCDANRKILFCIHNVDFTTSQKRQVLPGMIYELPPSQNKSDPLSETREGFFEKISESGAAYDKFIMNTYMGISPLISREIALDCNDANGLWNSFSEFLSIINNNDFYPCDIRDENKKLIEYSFMEIKQYGEGCTCERIESFGLLLDKFFSEKTSSERIRQKGGDLLKVIDNAISRTSRKIEALKMDLGECSKKEEYKRHADLIVSNMHMIKPGVNMVRVVDYYDESMPEITIKLNPQMTASANSQALYKKYNKLKNGEVELEKQIEIAQMDMNYLNSVKEEFQRAETETDLAEIKRELYNSGYGSRIKGYTPQKEKSQKVMTFTSPNGYKVLCGKNNTQNDYITHKLAARSDYWFHVKKAHGSHVILECNNEEPPAEDFSFACNVAAYYSEKRDGVNVEVDYTKVYNLKKPSGSKPGFVVYNTNYSAVITPNKDLFTK